MAAETDASDRPAWWTPVLLRAPGSWCPMTGRAPPALREQRAIAGLMLPSPSRAKAHHFAQAAAQRGRSAAVLESGVLLRPRAAGPCPASRTAVELAQERAPASPAEHHHAGISPLAEGEVPALAQRVARRRPVQALKQPEPTSDSVGISPASAARTVFERSPAFLDHALVHPWEHAREKSPQHGAAVAAPSAPIQASAPADAPRW